VRFKDENGKEFPEWISVTIEEVASFIKGSQLSKSDIAETGISCILYGELYTK